MGEGQVGGGDIGGGKPTSLGTLGLQARRRDPEKARSWTEGRACDQKGNVASLLGNRTLPPT